MICVFSQRFASPPRLSSGGPCGSRAPVGPASAPGGDASDDGDHGADVDGGGADDAGGVEIGPVVDPDAAFVGPVGVAPDPAGRSGFPQFGQNETPSGSFVPHWGQNAKAITHLHADRDAGYSFAARSQ